MDEGSTVNSTVLLASFAVYTLAIVAVGLYSARYARRSDEDYFLAGRSLSGWVAALSASASWRMAEQGRLAMTIHFILYSLLIPNPNFINILISNTQG